MNNANEDAIFAPLMIDENTKPAAKGPKGGMMRPVGPRLPREDLPNYNQINRNLISPQGAAKADYNQNEYYPNDEPVKGPRKISKKKN